MYSKSFYFLIILHLTIFVFSQSTTIDFTISGTGYTISDNTVTISTDGTYDLITKEPVSFGDGYQVSFETDSRNYESGYYTDEEYDDLVYKLAAILNVNASLGVYENNPEVSYHIKEKNTSLAMAALYNQISIWDWANDHEILNEFKQDKYR